MFQHDAAYYITRMPTNSEKLATKKKNNCNWISLTVLNTILLPLKGDEYLNKE